MARRIGVRKRKVVAVVDESDARVASSNDVSFLPLPKTLDHLSDADIFRKVVMRNGELVEVGSTKPVTELRLAFVGAWGIPCGISTFAEALWPPMWQGVTDWRLFVEGSPEGVDPSENVVKGLWKRGESLAKLAEAIEDFAPDAVFIQHEYGIFPDARHWLAFITRIREYRPIVTMHSVYDHADKVVCEAAIPEIVVHSELARAALVDRKQISSKVSIIKHGCGTPKPNRLWNLYRSNHTFTQFGFGFRYKNWEAPIRATALLKETYPDVFFTGIFSEGMFSKEEHDRYYGELMDLAKHLEVQDHIAILRGYASESVLNSYLGTNQIAVFPYLSDKNHIVYGASGASRRAMETGIPVIVSREPHFCDLAGICPVADTADELAQQLSLLFESEEKRADLVREQNKFLEENSWAKAGQAYLRLVTGDL